MVGTVSKGHQGQRHILELSTDIYGGTMVGKGRLYLGLKAVHLCGVIRQTVGILKSEEWSELVADGADVVSKGRKHEAKHGHGQHPMLHASSSCLWT